MRGRDGLDAFLHAVCERDPFILLSRRWPRNVKHIRNIQLNHDHVQRAEKHYISLPGVRPRPTNKFGANADPGTRIKINFFRYAKFHLRIRHPQIAPGALAADMGEPQQRIQPHQQVHPLPEANTELNFFHYAKFSQQRAGRAVRAAGSGQMVEVVQLRRDLQLTQCVQLPPLAVNR